MGLWKQKKEACLGLWEQTKEARLTVTDSQWLSDSVRARLLLEASAAPHHLHPPVEVEPAGLPQLTTKTLSPPSLILFCSPSPSLSTNVGAHCLPSHGAGAERDSGRVVGGGAAALRGEEGAVRRELSCAEGERGGEVRQRAQVGGQQKQGEVAQGEVRCGRRREARRGGGGWGEVRVPGRGETWARFIYICYFRWNFSLAPVFRTHWDFLGGN